MTTTTTTTTRTTIDALTLGDIVDVLTPRIVDVLVTYDIQPAIDNPGWFLFNGRYGSDGITCECPDHEYRRRTCKHAWCVRLLAWSVRRVWRYTWRAKRSGGVPNGTR